jgi:hypothetical protein
MHSELENHTYHMLQVTTPKKKKYQPNTKDSKRSNLKKLDLQILVELEIQRMNKPKLIRFQWMLNPTLDI